MSTWIHHPGLDRFSEVEPESVAAWEELGWVHAPDGPPGLVDPGRYTEDEILARAALANGITVSEPDPGVSIETPPEPDSTADASLNQDPQED